MRSGANAHARPATRPLTRATACQARASGRWTSDSRRCPPAPYSGTSALIAARASSGSAIASSAVVIHHGSQPRSKPTASRAEASTSAPSHAPTMCAPRARACSTPRCAAAASITRGKLSIRWPSWACHAHRRPLSSQTSPPPATATAAFHAAWLISQSAIVADTPGPAYRSTCHSQRNSRTAARLEPIAHAASTSSGCTPGECPLNVACSALNPAPVGSTLARSSTTAEWIS